MLPSRIARWCTGFLSLLTMTGCFIATGEPTLREAPVSTLRPCYVPRVDQFYFEKDWLGIKGRELEGMKMGNALWWMAEASWNESFDPREVYGAEQEIFGTLSRTPQTPRPAVMQQARLLLLEENDTPAAPRLFSVRVTDSTAFFYHKTLSRGQRKDPKGAACWGGVVIREQRALPVREAQPVLDCFRELMENRVRAEAWKPLAGDGPEHHYLFEYQDSAMHGLAQYSTQSSNIDGVSIEKLRECSQKMVNLATRGATIPLPTLQ
ncbi:MAG: hypothetical protein MUF64_19070 [Polyangiaceae bacterium]|jgi:hypothetical protein|nr:hypothetical protein [Polyangiaceae bacterium]